MTAWVWVWAWVWQSEDNLQVSVLSSCCVFWDWNSGREAWQQAPLLLSHLASLLIRMSKLVVITQCARHLIKLYIHSFLHHSPSQEGALASHVFQVRAHKVAHRSVSTLYHGSTLALLAQTADALTEVHTGNGELAAQCRRNSITHSSFSKSCFSE